MRRQRKFYMTLWPMRVTKGKLENKKRIEPAPPRWTNERWPRWWPLARQILTRNAFNGQASSDSMKGKVVIKNQEKVGPLAQNMSYPRNFGWTVNLGKQTQAARAELSRKNIASFSGKTLPWLPGFVYFLCPSSLSNQNSGERQIFENMSPNIVEVFSQGKLI